MVWKVNFRCDYLCYTSSFAKKKPVDFDDELKVRGVKYDTFDLNNN